MILLANSTVGPLSIYDKYGVILERKKKLREPVILLANDIPVKADIYYSTGTN